MKISAVEYFLCVDVADGGHELGSDEKSKFRRLNSNTLKGKTQYWSSEKKSPIQCIECGNL